MNNAAELSHQLAHHTGSDTWFKHPFNRSCTYTEGVRTFAESAGGGAYWLLDILLTQPEIINAQREHGIVFITLAVSRGSAMLTVVPDTDAPALYTRHIDFTDCPEGQWKFYFGNDVLMLPSEY